MLKVEARSRSNDPIQEHLRQSKDDWNESVKNIIDDLINYKKLINGRPNKFFKEKSSIKYPIPGNASDILSKITGDFSKIVEKSNSIISEQNNYSKNRKKSKKELESLGLQAAGSNRFSRFLSKITSPGFGSNGTKNTNRISLLVSAENNLKSLNDLQSEIVKLNDESINNSIKMIKSSRLEWQSFIDSVKFLIDNEDNKLTSIKKDQDYSNFEDVFKIKNKLSKLKNEAIGEIGYENYEILKSKIDIFTKLHKKLHSYNIDYELKFKITKEIIELSKDIVLLWDKISHKIDDKSIDNTNYNTFFDLNYVNNISNTIDNLSVKQTDIIGSEKVDSLKYLIKEFKFSHSKLIKSDNLSDNFSIEKKLSFIFDKIKKIWENIEYIDITDYKKENDKQIIDSNFEKINFNTVSNIKKSLNQIEDEDIQGIDDKIILSLKSSLKGFYDNIFNLQSSLGKSEYTIKAKLYKLYLNIINYWEIINNNFDVEGYLLKKVDEDSTIENNFQTIDFNRVKKIEKILSSINENEIEKIDNNIVLPLKKSIHEFYKNLSSLQSAIDKSEKNIKIKLHKLYLNIINYWEKIDSVLDIEILFDISFAYDCLKLFENIKAITEKLPKEKKQNLKEGTLIAEVFGSIKSQIQEFKDNINHENYNKLVNVCQRMCENIPKIEADIGSELPNKNEICNKIPSINKKSQINLSRMLRKLNVKMSKDKTAALRLSCYEKIEETKKHLDDVMNSLENDLDLDYLLEQSSIVYNDYDQINSMISSLSLLNSSVNLKGNNIDPVIKRYLNSDRMKVLLDKLRKKY